EAAQPVRRDEVAGYADDEEFPRRLVEGQLGRDPGVGTAEDGGERRLALGARGTAGGEITLRHFSGCVACVALQQAGERGIGCFGRTGRLRDGRARRQGSDRSDGGEAAHSGEQATTRQTNIAHDSPPWRK